MDQVLLKAKLKNQLHELEKTLSFLAGQLTQNDDNALQLEHSRLVRTIEKIKELI